MVQNLRPFYWKGGFCLLVELWQWRVCDQRGYPVYFSLVCVDFCKVCQSQCPSLSVPFSLVLIIYIGFCPFYSVSVRFCLFLSVSVCLRILWYWCYYPHTTREWVSSVSSIFIWIYCLNVKLKLTGVCRCKITYKQNYLVHFCNFSCHYGKFFWDMHINCFGKAINKLLTKKFQKAKGGPYHIWCYICLVLALVCYLF